MTLKKVLSLSLSAFFFLFAYFQHNDPDPQYWIPLYLVPAVVCLLVLLDKTPPSWIYWGLAAFYLIAAISQWPPQFEGIFFGEMAMRSVNIELARESLGLGICAVAMLLLNWLSKR